MDAFKKRFKEDPYFAAAVTAGGIIILSRLVTSTAKMVEASAYAYRATKI